jgi:lipopolysaccharide/colanic/teichoic acid biosynthesis glycosyltransferase
MVVASLPLLVPFSIFLSLFIKLSSPGPVLFVQTRIGRGGVPFRCYKFRTMKPDACSSGHERHLAALMNSNTPMTKLDSGGDKRIIPGGRLLRSSGLDELPQLINVLKGEMSVVGPRPCLPYEYSLYTDRHKQRLTVVPGITGLWQVTGKNRTTFEEMIDLDIAYSKELSLAQDFSIVLRTAGVLLRQLLEAFDRSPSVPVVGTPEPARDRA